MRNRIISIGFIIFLSGFALVNAFLPYNSVSYTERRNLKKLQKPTMEAIVDASYMKAVETYALEQFVGRDIFRMVKANLEINILQKEDANTYYKVDEGLYKLDYHLNEANVKRAAEHFTKIVSEYFENANAYYAMIPDKNYFIARKNGYPAMDYEKLFSIMKENTKGIQNIDIGKELAIDDYYRTDLHWRQERIEDVAKKLLDEMQNTEYSEENETINYQEILCTENFKGGYAGQSALLSKAEPLIYLESDATRATTVYDYEKQESVPMYATNKIEGMDPYDVYLWGARALLALENKEQTNEKELVIFRDSFGSSLAPLLMEGYSKIFLVDLRYTTVEASMKLIEPSSDCDVLFLYSTSVVNSNSLKFY